MMLSFLKKTYHPLNTIQISRENLLDNYEYLAEISQTKIAPVLKSNAYGHGIVIVAKILDNVGAPFFCIDSIHEGYQLLKAHIKTPILIMGYIAPENLKIKKLPFMYAVYSEDILMAVKKYQPHAGIHVFVDTGMHREGVLLEDLPAFLKKAQRLNLPIAGLMSHFAMGDKPKNALTQKQVKNFQKAKYIFKKAHITPKYIHLSASSGILHAKDYQKGLTNVSRGGLALYGIDIEGKDTNLLPVLTLTTTVAQIKEIEKGEAIGYDCTFTAKKKMRIAILPIGYNDGVNRKLSNKGWVKIENTYCPIVGRVSMNITTIDISGLSVAVGDEVTVYSHNAKNKNAIYKAAKLCGVIPYELLVQLHVSTKRIIV